jgi:hypothetical protein
MQGNIWPLIGSSFTSFLLSFMLMKAWLPFAPKRTAEVLLEVPLGYLQRVLIHRTQAMLILAWLIAGTLFQELPQLTGGPEAIQLYLPGTEMASLIGLVVILMLPLRYVFTDRGVALNNGVARPYKGFRRFDVKPGRRGPLADNLTITLRGRKTAQGVEGSYSLFLPKAAQTDVVRLLKRHVR